MRASAQSKVTISNLNMSTPYLSATAAIALLFTFAPALSWAQDTGATVPGPAASPLAAPQPATLDEAKKMLVSTYGKIAEATYSDALSLGIQLRKEIKAFVAVLGGQPGPDPGGDGHPVGFLMPD